MAKMLTVDKRKWKSVRTPEGFAKVPVNAAIRDLRLYAVISGKPMWELITTAIREYLDRAERAGHYSVIRVEGEGTNGKRGKNHEVR